MVAATSAPMRDEDVFTLLDLLRKAAEHVGLKLEEGAREARSEPIITYTLDEALINFLKSHGYTTDRRSDDVFALGSESGHYWWLFDTKEGRAKEISLLVGLAAHRGDRGIRILPMVRGSAGATDNLEYHTRMFRLIAEFQDEKSPLVRELVKNIAANTEEYMVVGWTELGLGGIRSLRELFEEFSKGIEASRKLAIGSQNPFDPVPYPRYDNPGDEIYIPEPNQRAILRFWEKQLEHYRKSITRL